MKNLYALFLSCIQCALFENIYIFIHVVYALQSICLLCKLILLLLFLKLKRRKGNDEKYFAFEEIL